MCPQPRPHEISLLRRPHHLGAHNIKPENVPSKPAIMNERQEKDRFYP
jgi:hypothetical protein